MGSDEKKENSKKLRGDREVPRGAELAHQVQLRSNREKLREELTHLKFR